MMNPEIKNKIKNENKNKIKFAHMADLHLGATTDPVLRGLEMQTLQRALDTCIQEDMDFIIISGDIFHVNIPDLAVVRDSVKAFMKFVETGKKIYVVYGSHDFSPNSTSIIDILEEAGVFIRVGKPAKCDGKLRPQVVRDGRSGALLTGISGRKVSLEREAFINLDREYLASLEGFKIFVFHSGIDELKAEGEKYEGIASTDLPRGFDYYAGGHIHRRIEAEPSKMKVVFPGPLFTGWGTDMETTVRGERRGFFVVEIDGGVQTRFVDLTAFEGVYRELDATGLAATAVNGRLRALAEEDDVKGKVVVVKVMGELTSGKTSDVDFASMRDRLMGRGAIYLHLSRSQLRSRERGSVTAFGEPGEIEEQVFKEMAGTVRISDEAMRAGTVKFAKELLAQTKVSKKEGETESDYESRISSAAIEVLGIGKLLKG